MKIVRCRKLYLHEVSFVARTMHRYTVCQKKTEPFSASLKALDTSEPRMRKKTGSYTLRAVKITLSVYSTW